MLGRNCVLSVRWIYEIIYHIHGDVQADTGGEVTTNALLIVFVLAGENVIGLSYWNRAFHLWFVFVFFQRY